MGQWTDNNPGWEDRLREHLETVGVAEAKREVTEGKYRVGHKRIAEAWIASQDNASRQEFDLKMLNKAETANTIASWSMGVAVVAAFIALMALIHKVS